MCLDRLAFLPKLRRSYRERYGWKTFRKTYSGKLEFQAYPHNGGYKVPLNQWLHKSSPLKISTCSGRHYKAGFHIYLKKPDVPCKKVLWSDPLAVGVQDGLPVVVTRKLYVPKDEETTL